MKSVSGLEIVLLIVWWDLKDGKGKNLLNMPVLFYTDGSVQLSISCLFGSSKPPPSSSCSRAAENAKYPNYCRKSTYQIYFPTNNKLTNICRTYEGILCNRGLGYWEKGDTLCVSYCIAFFIASYCQLDSQWRNYTMLVFCLIIFQFLILQNIESLLFVFYFNGRNLDVARFDWFLRGLTPSPSLQCSS